MKLRRRVHIFQAALLKVLEEKIKDEENSTAQLAAIGCMVLLADAIDKADDEGAFEEDEDDVPQVREAAPSEG